MKTTLTELRAHLYQKIDQVISTGIPIEINRKGHVIKIISSEPPSKLKSLIRRENITTGDPEDFVHIDWSNEWTGSEHDLS